MPNQSPVSFVRVTRKHRKSPADLLYSANVVVAYKGIHFSHFLEAEGVHGGINRTRQISELLTLDDVEITYLRPIKGKIHSVGAELASTLGVFLELPKSYWRINKFSELYRAVSSIRRNSIDFAVTENLSWYPEQLAIIPKGRLIAMPQNLEFFVPSQTNGGLRQKVRLASQELRLLSAAAACFTICAEDNAMLSAFTNRSFVLPYFPPSSHLANLRRLRDARLKCWAAGQISCFALVLGSAINPPTSLGIERLLNMTTGKPFPFEIVVAGNETERFSRFSSSKVKILGAISDNQLFDLQTRAKCTLISHSPTTGSLTRIVDSLIGGIPVVADVYAARGAYMHKGIQVYSNFQEMVELIDSLAAGVPPEPQRPKEQEQRFVSEIRSLFAL